jgi:putative ABC transport system permease protein
VRQVNGELRAGRPAFVIGHFIDPKVYPFYDVIRAEQPRGALLRDLIAAPNQVVVGRRLADQLGIQLGDSLRIGTAQALQTVVGIVSDAVESSLTDPNTLLFSFVYIDRAALADFGLDARAANEIYLKLPEGISEREARAEIARWLGLNNFRFSRLESAEQVLERNALISDVISRFVLVLSLVGLVIGGIGIINTMFVNVNRRAGEIAVLKTLGLKGGQVSLIFLIEATMLGVLGSLLGAALGVLLSLIARDFGEQAFNVALPWRIYLDPLAIGVALGVTITVFFAFLPTLLAGQVRPIHVLRTGGIPLTSAGCLPSLLSLLVLIVGLGGLVDLIVNSNRIAQELNWKFPISLGILGVFMTFLLLGALLSAMWLLVWLLSKLPSLRNPNLRLALRGLTQHRLRTALSLLALVIGMTSLSGTLIMARSINMLLYTSLSEPLGGNVIILPLLPVQAAVRARLDSAEGVRGYREVRFVDADLVAINGNRNVEKLLPFDSDDPQVVLLRTQLTVLLGVNVYGAPKRGTLVAGRFLTPEDSGKDYIVLPYDPKLEAIGVRVGSQLTYRITSFGGSATRRERTFEVIGLVAPDARAGLIPISLSDGTAQVPLSALPAAPPFDLIIADVEQSALNDVMGKVGAVAGIFVFDISLFDSIITRLLTQLAALPILIAVFALFAAAALIATTVSLATLERRRQIGVMKAIGVKRRHVLAQLLIENGVVGLLAGLLSLLPTC